MSPLLEQLSLSVMCPCVSCGNPASYERDVGFPEVAVGTGARHVGASGDGKARTSDAQSPRASFWAFPGQAAL